MGTELFQNDRFRHRKDFFVGVNNITAFLGDVAFKESTVGDPTWGAALTRVQRDLLELKRTMPEQFEEEDGCHGIQDVLAILSTP